MATQHPTADEPPKYLPWVILALATALAVWVGSWPPTTADPARHRLVSALGSGASGKVLHDLNGDGRLDLAIAEGDRDQLARERDQDSLVCSIWLAEADGQLRRHAMLYGQSADLLVGLDVDQDGDQDLLAADSFWGQARLLLNDGHANFRPGLEVEMAGPENLTVTDFDGDGFPDLVAQGLGHAVGIWHNDGHGRFQFRNVDLSGGLQEDFRPVCVAVADVNRDGAPDVLVIGDPSHSIDGSQLLSLHYNDGHGRLTRAARIAVPHLSYAVALGDLNGDGWPDLVLAQNRGNTPALLHVLLNDRQGRFGTAPKLRELPYSGSSWDPITLGQEVDMLVSQTEPGMGDFYQVALGDVDHDGDLDLVAASQFGSYIRVRRNDGHAHFAAPYAVTANNGFDKGELAIADIDNDGRLESLAPQQVLPTNSDAPAVGDRAVLSKLW